MPSICCPRFPSFIAADSTLDLGQELQGTVRSFRDAWGLVARWDLLASCMSLISNNHMFETMSDVF